MVLVVRCRVIARCSKFSEVTGDGVERVCSQAV